MINENDWTNFRTFKECNAIAESIERGEPGPTRPWPKPAAYYRDVAQEAWDEMSDEARAAFGK